MKRISYGVKFLVASIIILSVVSTYFYSFVEGWAFVDAFYFTISTITTVGYGDFVPTTSLSKLFTSGIAFIGIAMVLTLFGMVSAHYVRVVNEKEESKQHKLKEEKKKQEVKIKQLETKFKKAKEVLRK